MNDTNQQPISFLKKWLIRFHQKFSHNNRIEILSDEISNLINKLFVGKAEIHCLDLGAGDLGLSTKISQKTKASIEWLQLDVHRLSDEESTSKYWKNYRQYDGKNIPAEENSFQLGIICDVLHHDIENASILISEAARTSEYLLIKDHYEYGIYSRTILRLMDFVGNWGYDVTIPKRYFTPETFIKLMKENNLEEISKLDSIALYNHLPILRTMLRPDWQFIKLLKCN